MAHEGVDNPLWRASALATCTSSMACTGAYGAPLGGADVVIKIAVHPDDVCFC